MTFLRFAVAAVAAVDDVLGPSDVDPDEARDAACDATAGANVCRVPDTLPDRPPPEPSTSADLSTGGGVLGQVLVILLVAALVIALVWMIMRWLGDRRRRTDAGTEEVDELDEDLDDPVEERIVDHARPPDRWRRAAEEHRAAGAYRDAIRCEYRALVGDLARAGYVDEIPGRTSGEERRQLAELAPHVAADFDVAAGLFDEAWFNDDDVVAAQDERFLAAERSVLDVVLTGTAAGRRR